MKTEELATLGFPPAITHIWLNSGFRELLPLQEQAIREFALLDIDGTNLLIIAPTSAGKSFLGEFAAVNEALKMRKAFLIVPFRAIAEELFADLAVKYSEYGLWIAISDSDHREYDEDIIGGDFDIAVVVYEKLAGLLVAMPGLLDSPGLIVADEIQMVMDHNRGPSIELLLTKILSSGALRIIALSAVLDNLNDFDKWLTARVLRSKTRPIELRESIYSSDGTVEYREFNSHQKGSQKLSSWNQEEEGLHSLIDTIDAAGEQALIFCATRRSTISIARKIASWKGSSHAAIETIKRSGDLPDTPDRESLQDLLHSGVAFHNSDLSLEERLLVENGFRQRDIRVLTCTSTLSMGVNLPSRNVIIYGTNRWVGSRSVPISVADYKNMSGRAGRYSAGDKYGTCYLLAPSRSARDTFMSNYLLGTFEGFESAFGDQVIDMQVLQIVAGNLATTPAAASDFVLKTYNGRFRWKTEQSRKAIHQMVLAGVHTCIDAGAMEQKEDGSLRVTDAGRLCAAGGFTLTHLQRARAFLSQREEVVEASTLFWALKTDYESAGNAYYIGRLRTAEYASMYYQRLLTEISRDSKLGSQLEELADHPASIGYDDTVVLRRALACLFWISDTTTKKLLDTFPEVTVGAIRNTADVCARLISFLYDLSKIKGMDSTVQDTLSELSLRLIHASTKEALPLARIRRSGLSRDERNHLVKSGIDSVAKVLERDIGDIPLLRSKATRLLTAIEESIADNQERRRRSQRSRLHAIAIDTTLLDAMYSSQGKDLEMVIDELLKPPFISLVCRRVSRQTEGEPDHILYTSTNDAIVIQTTARERKLLTMTKTTSVVGQSSKYKPVGYVVFGRPDFDDLSIRDSQNQELAGRNFKLIPIFVLCEMYVLYQEKRISSSFVETVLVEKTGYWGIRRLYDMLKSLGAQS